jgi:5'-nucleotidase/UDP-sugar diphosphatase
VLERFTSPRLLRLVATAALAALTLGCSQYKTIVVFHTSDVHGHIASRPAKWHKPNPKRMVGGYAALASLVRKEKHPHVILDSGDIFQGTPVGSISRGQASVTLMNALGYSAAVIGNHEYDFGEQVIREMAKSATFPFVSANIFRRSDGKPVSYAKPTHMLNVGGVKVGVVGLTTEETATATLPKNVRHLRFADIVSTARKHAVKLRKQGAHIVIALTHCGVSYRVSRTWLHPRDFVVGPSDLKFKGDIHIARGAPVDIVFGGHTHTGFEEPWVDPVSGVAFVESFEKLIAASRIEITVDVTTSKVVSIRGKLIPLWIDKVGEAPDILKLTKRVRRDIDKQVSVKIGDAPDALKRVHGGLDSPIGNWMTDIMRRAAGSDIAFQNSHGIRNNIEKGPITLRDVYTVMPFDSTLVVVTLTGAQVQQMLRDNIRGSSSRVQVSGLTVRYKLKLDGHSVGDLNVRVGGAPLDPKRNYTVATNSYLSSGGRGARVMVGAPQKDLGVIVRDVVVNGIRKAPVLKAPPTGRIQILR